MPPANGDTDAFLFTGQSLNIINPNGTPPSGLAPTFPDHEAVYWTGSGLASLSGLDGPGTAFCKAWYDATGRLAVMIPGAVASTPLLKVADASGNGWWNPVDGGGSSLLTNAVGMSLACLDWLVANGRKPYTNMEGNYAVSGTLWDGLQTDARRFNAGIEGITQGAVIAGLQAILSVIRSNGHFASGFYVNRIGTSPLESDSGFALMRQAEDAFAWPNNGNAFIMNSETVNYPVIGLQPPDDLHPNQRGFNDIGGRMAFGVRNLFAIMGL